MRIADLMLASVVAGAVVIGSGSRSSAQTPGQDAVVERVRELQRRLLVEGGDRADQAASDLFVTGLQGRTDLGPEGTHDAFLLGVLADETSKRDARLAILRGLKDVGRFRVDAACRLVLEAMDDPAPQVVTLAVQTFPALDDDHLNVYRWALQALTGDLRRARPDTPRGRQQQALIDALERMPNPIESVGVLVAVLETPRGVARGLEQRARESLQRFTAQSFEGAKEWRAWYEEAKARSLSEWRQDVARRRDDRLRRFESEAERYFGKLLASVQGDPEAFRRELQAALNDPDTVFAVRRTAIRELGQLGRQNEWAVTLLRGRLAQASSFEYDETRALVIEALGETGNRAVLDDVMQFLPATFHQRMRMAAVSAIGALQAPRGVDLLLAILDDTTAPDDLIEVAIDALGRIRLNPDGRVSGSLTRLARGLRGAGNAGGGGVQASPTLAAIAKALGALPYSPGGDEAKAVTALLTELAAYESGAPSADANVRLAATTALGVLPDAFPVLEARAAQGMETEPKVRRAIADAIGQQALDHPDLVDRAMLLLAGMLGDGDDTLRRKSHARLEDLAVRPPTFTDTFVGYESLLRALANKATVDTDALAVSFLSGERGLPAPEALTPAQLQPENKARYYALLGVRARRGLGSDPAAALADFEATIKGLDLGAPGSPSARALQLGRARALLRVTPARPRDALLALTPCLQATPAPAELAELWPVVLEAADRLKASDPAALGPLLGPLQTLAAGTTPDVKARLDALRGTP